MIYVKAADGHVFSLQVNQNERIIDIKMKIQDRIKLSSNKQILMYQGRILDDNIIFKEYHIDDNSVVEVLSQIRDKIQLFIKTLNGKAIEVFVTASERIFNIKKMIEELKGLSLGDQTLIYKGRSLDNDKSIDEYQIEAISVIELVIESRHRTQIIVKTIEGKAIVLTVMKCDKIIDIMKMVEEKAGISADVHKLVYQGKIMSNCKTVDDYQIVENSVLDIVAQLRSGMKIFVKLFNGNLVSLEVSKKDRIIDLKTKIHELTRMSPEEYKIVYQGQILKKYFTVEECNITEKSVIDAIATLRNGMRIFAKTINGYILELEVTKCDRIIDVKKQIQEKIELIPDTQQLVYQGVILEDNVMIDEYQIEDKSVIDVMEILRLEKHILVKTSDGQVVSIQVGKRDKLTCVKNKIKEQIGPLPDVHKMIYKGMICEDDGFIDDCDIDETSVINVVTMLRNGILVTVKSENQEEFTLEVTKLDNIIEVKKMIAAKTGVSPDEQRLVYQKGILDDRFTVEDYEIEEMGVIDVVLMPS